MASRSNVPMRHFGDPIPGPKGMTPSPSVSMAMLDSNASRPAPSTSSQMTMSFSSSTATFVGQDDPSFGTVQPGMFKGPTPLTSLLSCAPSIASLEQAQLPFMVQVQPPWSSSGEQKVVNPSVKHCTGLFSTSTSSFHQDSQATLGSIQHQLQSINTLPSCTDNPQSSLASTCFAERPDFKPSSTSVGSIYSASAVPLQPTFSPYYGVQRNEVAQPAPALLPAISSAYQVGYTPTSPATHPALANQGNHIPPPPIAASLGAQSRNQMQQPVSGPPLGIAQGVIEDFNSILIGSAPGSIDSGLDSKTLQRPLEGDVETNAFAEQCPMNCHSRYLRFTTYGMPNCRSLVSRWHLPLGAVICPLAESPTEEEVPVVNFPMNGIIRCKMCGIFVNPYITFMDGGRKWNCNFCTFLNDVPAEYFACLDSNGRRMDLDKRTELTKGSIEYITTHDSMFHTPMPPVYLFLIDVSIHAAKSGMLEIVADTVRSCLDKLPGFSRAQIGFITFDSRVHFYNMKSSLTQPQMMVISDLDDIFVPIPSGLLVNLSESKTVVDAFLDSLTSMFNDNLDMESAFGPAIKAATMVMTPSGGKLLIFQNTLPSLGVGSLRLRWDDHHIYGTDKEHMLRLPENPFYQEMAAELVKHQIVVDLYAFSDKYTDIASLGTLSKYTGGQVNYYPNFLSACHKEKLKYELSRDLTRKTAWEALMRIRCGGGMRFTTVHGNLMFRATDFLSLPAFDCDKAYTALLCLEGTFLNSQALYFQVSLLYTSSSGERHIRVHTAAVPVVADLAEMYRRADTGAIISLFCRLAIEKTLSHKLVEARTFIQQQIVKSFREYQNLIAAQNRLGGRMFYPESLKYLPLFGLSLCKSKPLRGGCGDAQLDERSAEGNAMMALPVKRLMKLLYPSLFQIDEYILNASANVDEFNKTCKRLPLSAKNLDDTSLYIYDDGCRFVIIFGRMLSPDIAVNLLGEGVATDLSKISLCEHDNRMSRALMLILEKLRVDNPSCYQLPHPVRQGEQPGEGELLKNLIEDTVDGLGGYADWILKIYQQIQQNF